MKARQQGFTIIELVFVITIIGILAAFAIPQFVDLQRDARVANVNALAGSVRSAATMIYGKALVDQKEKLAALANATVNIAGGQTVDIAFGYPKRATGGIDAAVDAQDYIFDTATGTFSVKDSAGVALANCNVIYTEASATNPFPTVSTNTTGC